MDGAWHLLGCLSRYTGIIGAVTYLAISNTENSSDALAAFLHPDHVLILYRRSARIGSLSRSQCCYIHSVAPRRWRLLTQG